MDFIFKPDKFYWHEHGISLISNPLFEIGQYLVKNSSDLVHLGLPIDVRQYLDFFQHPT
jgi:hypothetical protein